MEQLICHQDEKGAANEEMEHRKHRSRIVSRLFLDRVDDFLSLFDVRRRARPWEQKGLGVGDDVGGRKAWLLRRSRCARICWTMVS
mmetsp:Transcript_31195/g.100419  ORF Transcript_31195/g.100419 Transcript_31195/m.100419 type:complete len:86 (+) Transcript_31195:447-704(+)